MLLTSRENYVTSRENYATHVIMKYKVNNEIIAVLSKGMRALDGKLDIKLEWPYHQS